MWQPFILGEAFMLEIDARELIWRAYTTNKSSFQNKAKEIISYASNQEVVRSMFVRCGEVKSFAFNEQMKQWEMQKDVNKWCIFSNPESQFEYESKARKMVEQEIFDRFLNAVKESLPWIGKKEALIIDKYVKNLEKKELMCLLNKIQSKGFLSYYEHTHEKELQLLKNRDCLLQSKNTKEQVDVKEVSKLVMHISMENGKSIDDQLAENEELQKKLLAKQMEVYFNTENEEYFGIEIPLDRLQDFLVLEKEKEKILKEKGLATEDVTKHIGKLERKIASVNGDVFTRLLEQNSEALSIFSDKVDLTPKLFSMVNNDAWLVNSSFQGGDPSETASMFSDLFTGIEKKDSIPKLVELEAVVSQIQENGEKISVCVKQGKAFEKMKDVLFEKDFSSVVCCERNMILPDIASRNEKVIYIVEMMNRLKRYDESSFFAHYYDGVQWCSLEEKEHRFYFLGEEKKQNVSHVMSSFGIFENLKEKNERKLEQERFELIKSLAVYFQFKIQTMEEGKSFFMPGGFFEHAMLYEFKKENDGKINLIVYNTGAGLEYHEHKIVFNQGVFKEKHFPACVYQFSSEKTNDKGFQDYLVELLKTNIASSWEKISSNPDVLSVAKKSDQEDLYQCVLPLIIHLDGIRVDPKTVVKNCSFITGQRSGKCSEAIFHPIVRSRLSECNYQRFMCAYRKESIAKFVSEQGEKDQLSNPVVQRQIKNAVSNLSKRLYKNQRFFTQHERFSIAKFFSDITQKLDLAVKSCVVDIIVETPVVLDVSMLEPEIFPRIKESVSNIDTRGTQELKEQKDDIRERLNLLVCKPQDEMQNLIGRMEAVLSLAEKASLKHAVDHREIVFQIEKMLMTWPLDKEVLDISVEDKDKDKVVNNVKKLIAIYCKQSLLQFGLNLNETFPQLFPQQVATLLSGLAIVVQATNGQEAICMKELMNSLGVSNMLRKNKLNPYLASAEFQCDVRIQALLGFFSEFPKSSVSIKEIYGKLVEENVEQKKCLLGLYDDFIARNPKEYKTDQEALTYLSDVDKCILVLCRCKNELSNNLQIKELVRKFDFLVNMDNIQAILGGMLSSKIKNCENELLKSLSSENLKFYAIKDSKDRAYQWIFDTPSTEILKKEDCLCVDYKVFQKSEGIIKDEMIVLFLRNDINCERKYLGENPFQSSAIQVPSSKGAGEAITAEGFCFKQFCHSRSSVDNQVLSTINFFQDNVRLLGENKWQSVCELNLFQPGLLLKALQGTPSAYNTLDAFLKKGFLENIQEDVPNAAAFFFVKMQISVNNYLIESNFDEKENAIKNLEELNSRLSDMIGKMENKTLVRNLYFYQASLIGRLMPYVEGEKKIALIQGYIKAKLFGVKEKLSTSFQNPFNFMMQENIVFNMATHLIENKEIVEKACSIILNERKDLTPTDVTPFSQYPNVFYSYVDNVEKHLIMINLETGKILKDGKEFLPLPEILFNNDQFIDLFAYGVDSAFHCMLPGDREPSVYEISKRDYKESVDYWVKKTGNSYVFQKALLSEDHVLLRYQLISYESLGNLNHFLPETLTDNNHRFWLSVEEPQELIIEEKSTNKEVCRVKNFNTEKSYIESSIYKIWTQKQVANSLLGKRFSCFENTAFIEIRELQMAPYHDDLVRNKPLYIITLPRYQLTFHVANINPLVINSVNPLGKLLLSETFHNLTNIKNALFLEKESGGNVALLPRQYFISDTSLSHDKFEYMPVVLDVENKHQDLVLNKKNSEKVYKKQSEFLEFTMSDDGKIAAKNSADALYLAYVYLANFDPEASLRVLQECEKSGGIKLTQREMEHLMLMFTSLPAVSESNENVSQKMINTPEFIAVKAYALYLYASAQYKKTSFEFEEPLGSDGECFCNEAKNFKKNLQKYIDTFLIKYQSVKNDIPVDMQLTAQQELECLDLSDAPLLVLVKKRLLVENLQKEDLTVLNPNQKEEVQASKNRLLEDKLSESQSQYRTQQYSVGATASKDETTLVNLINLPRIKYISGKTPKDCIEKYSSKEKVKIAMEQLSLNLELENFFKSFLTYYYIVTSTEPPLTEEKNALKEFLTCKLKILGNNHPLYGKELIIILYKILDNPNEVINLKKMEIFLKEVHGESLGYNLRKVIDGYYFDSYEFYNYLMGFFKDLTVTIEVEGVKREENSLEPMKLQETFSKNESVLSKPLVYDPPKLLFYSGKGNILKKYKLKSMEDVEMESISIEFLKKYREILSNGETNFLNAKERFKKEKVEFFNFEKFSFQELIFEKELGDVQNKTSQNQVALAKQYFSIEENQKKVYGKVKACLNEAKQAKAKLLDLIKKTVNHGPILNELNR